MDLESRINQIKTREDLVEFISMLHEDLEKNPGGWENPSLPRYLAALGAWVGSMDQYYQNQGLEFSEQQPWELFATMLLSARVYE